VHEIYGDINMKIHGKMLVKNFKKAFADEFGVGINVHNGFSTGSYADDGATLASIRSDKAGDASGELDLHGNMSVGTAENSIKDSLGFKVQILDKSGKNADNAARLSALR
jgi:tryptophanase